MSGVWQDVCSFKDLIPDTGVCALFTSENGLSEQVAIFLENISGKLFAVSNYDPCGKANVISRGIIGSVEDQLVIASPLYKQHFNLETGSCLEEPEKSLKIYQIRHHNGRIEITSAS